MAEDFKILEQLEKMYDYINAVIKIVGEPSYDNQEETMFIKKS